MNRTVVTFGIIAAGIAAAACGGGNAKASGPNEIGGGFDGVTYTAEVQEIIASTTRRFTVVATLTNTKSVAVTRVYPAGCPVRIKLHRALDNELVYDETKIPCSVTTETTVTIPPGETRTLQSGVRWPPTVLGDSLAATSYNVRAVVQTEGTRVVEVAAGTYKVPDCQEQGTVTVCN